MKYIDDLDAKILTLLKVYKEPLTTSQIAKYLFNGNGDLRNKDNLIRSHLKGLGDFIKEKKIGRISMYTVNDKVSYGNADINIVEEGKKKPINVMVEGMLCLKENESINLISVQLEPKNNS